MVSFNSFKLFSNIAEWLTNVFCCTHLILADWNVICGNIIKMNSIKQEVSSNKETIKTIQPIIIDNFELQKENNAIFIAMQLAI